MSEQQSYSILIVDDEPSNILILDRILKEQYTVFAVRTGKAALKIAAEKMPELILLDLILPDICGYEVLSELKSSELTRDIPVIIISGLDGEQNEQEGLRLGAEDYITKPFNSQNVKEKIADLLYRGN